MRISNELLGTAKIFLSMVQIDPTLCSYPQGKDRLGLNYVSEKIFSINRSKHARRKIEDREYKSKDM